MQEENDWLLQRSSYYCYENPVCLVVRLKYSLGWCVCQGQARRSLMLGILSAKSAASTPLLGEKEKKKQIVVYYYIL